MNGRLIQWLGFSMILATVATACGAPVEKSDDDDGGSSNGGASGNGSSGSGAGSSASGTGSGAGSSGTGQGSTGSGPTCDPCDDNCGLVPCQCPDGSVINATACDNGCCLPAEEVCQGVSCCAESGSSCFDGAECCSGSCVDDTCE